MDFIESFLLVGLYFLSVPAKSCSLLGNGPTDGASLVPPDDV